MELTWEHVVVALAILMFVRGVTEAVLTHKMMVRSEPNPPESDEIRLLREYQEGMVALVDKLGDHGAAEDTMIEAVELYTTGAVAIIGHQLHFKSDDGRIISPDEFVRTSTKPN